MIYLGSRYWNGPISKVYDRRRDQENLTVFRSWPTANTKFSVYYWAVGDRLDTVSQTIYGSPDYWWKIMDLNPEITDPSSIKPGTYIRLPNVV